MTVLNGELSRHLVVLRAHLAGYIINFFYFIIILSINVHLRVYNLNKTPPTDQML